MYKKSFLCMITVLVIMLFSLNVQAKKYQPVQAVVTTNSGERIEGWITRHWSPFLSMTQFSLRAPARSFKFASTPDGADEKKYTTKDVKCIDFKESIDNYPCGGHWEPIKFARPTMFRVRGTYSAFACVQAKSPHATLYHWDYLVTEDHTVIYYDCIGIRMDWDSTVYPILTPHAYNIYAIKTFIDLMKKPNKPLYDYLKDYFYGKDGGAHYKSIRETPSKMLAVYEQFYKQNH